MMMCEAGTFRHICRFSVHFADEGTNHRMLPRKECENSASFIANHSRVAQALLERISEQQILLEVQPRLRAGTGLLARGINAT
jgi:hypothetical protein